MIHLHALLKRWDLKYILFHFEHFISLPKKYNLTGTQGLLNSSAYSTQALCKLKLHLRALAIQVRWYNCLIQILISIQRERHGVYWHVYGTGEEMINSMYPCSLVHPYTAMSGKSIVNKTTNYLCFEVVLSFSLATTPNACEIRLANKKLTSLCLYLYWQPVGTVQGPKM